MGSAYATRYTSRWKQAHKHIVKLAADQCRLDYKIGRALLSAYRTGAHRQLGFSSFAEYGDRMFGWGRRVSVERLRVARALELLPVLRVSLREAKLKWSVIKELTRIATVETEAEWRDHALGMTSRDVEEAVSGRRVGDRPGDRKRPEDRLYAIHHEVHSETISLYREARMKLERQVGHSLSDDDFILMMSRTVLEGPKDSGRANHQISMTVCEDCGRGRQQAGGVDVEVAPEVVEMARCDAQIVSGAHVGAQGAAPASQDVTPATRREVVARDRGRCAVPGCRNCVYVDIHHVVPRARGGSHQAQNLILLCGAHHRAHHRGRLGIRGDSTGVKFFHADGTPYGSGGGWRASRM